MEDLVKGNAYQIHQVYLLKMFFNLFKKLEHLQNQFDLMKIKLDEEQINKKTYEHMLDRMKKDKISNKILSSITENKLNKVSHVYENQNFKKQKLKQFHIQSQHVLDELMKV